MFVAVLLGLMVLIPLGRVSWWVWKDAAKRNMSPRWAIAVGLMFIICFPLYLLVRKPVKCPECGRNMEASLSLCQDCEELIPAEECEGRPGRILG